MVEALPEVLEFDRLPGLQARFTQRDAFEADEVTGDRVVVRLGQRLRLAQAAHGLLQKHRLARAELTEHRLAGCVVADLDARTG